MSSALADAALESTRKGEAAGPFVELRSAAGLALVAACVLASSIAFLGGLVVQVAAPAIAGDLRADMRTLQWTVTGYFVTAAALLLMSGALADRFGRRRVLASGLLVMLVASALCAAAPSVELLIASRFVQGAGAALVVPSSLALLNGSLPPADRSPGIGVWAGLATIGTTVGPFAGGWLVDIASWRWVFLLHVPLITVALVVLRYVPTTAPRGVWLGPDVAGGLLAVGGLGGVVYALTDGSARGWLTPEVLCASMVSLLALAALVPVERRVRAPMLKLSLFRSRQFNAINGATALFYGSLAGAAYLVILQCQLQLGYSATQAGAALIPQSVLFLVVSPLSGALVERAGPRWLMAWGIFAVAAGLAWLSAAQPGSTYMGAILPGVLLSGLGLGLAVTPLTSAVLGAVKDPDLGEAAAINDASGRVGTVIAIAFVPALIGATGGSTFGRALTDGYQPAMIALAGICAGAAIVSALFISNGRVPASSLALTAPSHGCVPLLAPSKWGTEDGKAE